MTINEVLHEADPALVKRFLEYHAEHPEVWRLFKQYANTAYRSGRKHYSAWAIMNRVRWDHDMKKTEEFKISNDYIALYSRTLMHYHPKYKGFFRTRPMRGGTHGCPEPVTPALYEG